MIDGQNSVYPIIIFDESSGWDDVLNLGQPDLDEAGLKRLKSLLRDCVRTVIIERHYIDKDYRDTFSYYHSKRFSTPSSRCLRLHFFKKKITRDMTASSEQINQFYLGYSIIRPTKPNCIGRTLLEPESQQALRAHISLCKERVFLRGIELQVEGFPFISQDTDVTVCAESALWMLARYFSNRYPIYKESYPSTIGNLTQDYSLGRIWPSAGLYVWQMAEALRRLGFAPLIYSRTQFTDFDHLLYTYIESGIPLLICFSNHVVVGYGHRSIFPKNIKITKENIFTSLFNQAFVINDDNEIPYQVIKRHKTTVNKKYHLTGISNYSFNNIVDFVVPLPERVFLPAENFQRVVLEVLKDIEFGYKSLSKTIASSKLVLRLFLTTSRSFKRTLDDRCLGSKIVEEVYRNLPLPHFIWICEISTLDLYLRDMHKIWGEVIWDATRNAYEPKGWIALHYPEILIVDSGSAFNGPQDLQRIDLHSFSPYPIYRGNLVETKK